MNKIWIIAALVLACTAGIFGIYSKNLGEKKVNPVLNGNASSTDKKLQGLAEAATGTAITGNISYTDEELQALYRKYNITENDLKFAKDELPNYLEGTVLKSDKRVIVTATGTPPDDLKKGRDYDIVISEQEMEDILEKAREAYIQKYGVDPKNPKVDNFNGYLLPHEEVVRLVSLHPEMVKE